MPTHFKPGTRWGWRALETSAGRREAGGLVEVEVGGS